MGTRQPRHTASRNHLTNTPTNRGLRVCLLLRTSALWSAGVRGYQFYKVASVATCSKLRGLCWLVVVRCLPTVCSGPAHSPLLLLHSHRDSHWQRPGRTAGHHQAVPHSPLSSTAGLHTGQPPSDYSALQHQQLAVTNSATLKVPGVDEAHIFGGQDIFDLHQTQ